MTKKPKIEYVEMLTGSGRIVVDMSDIIDAKGLGPMKASGLDDKNFTLTEITWRAPYSQNWKVLIEDENLKRLQKYLDKNNNL